MDDLASLFVEVDDHLKGHQKDMACAGLQFDIERVFA